jgi:pyruvate formate lyase activating enzyme
MRMRTVSIELGDALLHLARDAIAGQFGIAVPAAPALKALDEPGATFVTLTQGGQLRGCIGTLEAYRPLLRDVQENAMAAAFRDPRFAPLRADELPRTRVEVSLLAAPKPIYFKDEQDALAQLVPCHLSAAGMGKPARTRAVHGTAQAQSRIAGRLLARATHPCPLSGHEMEGTGGRMGVTESNYPGRWWHRLDDGRIQCDLCPRDCRLHEGQRGACFVRKMDGGRMLLTTYGRSSGFCIDPIEKKPLNHFYPGTSVFSFGTAGCNLACKFCQNWDISKSREMDTLLDAASPETIAQVAARHGCRSVAFTYNDPVIFAEYAMDTADACHAVGIDTVAVTAGYIHAAARREFYAKMDAANVDLKGFTDDFYVKLTGAHLQPVLDTLVYVKHETDVWIEITTLLIPGKNDSDQEIEAMSKWIMRELGADVPLHFSAFHPDYKMTDVPPTPTATLSRARRIALAEGIHHVYTGNVHDVEGGSTFCPGCGRRVIERDWYKIGSYNVTADGHCEHCGSVIAGRFEKYSGQHGRNRVPIRVSMPA